MSGPLGSQQWMYASGGFYDFPIEQSLRFNDNDSAYLSRTPATAGNRRTWTWSGWVKRGNLNANVVGNIPTLFAAQDSGPGLYNFIAFLNNVGNDVIYAQLCSTPSNAAYILETSQVFRDMAGWYHIVWSVDTTQATASDRAKLYVNGEQVTSFSTEQYPPQNTDTDMNYTVEHNIGKFPDYTRYYDGYMAEVNFIDGQALDPTSFGELKSGIWIPKDTSGLTFGTNGFRLQYGNSAAIGDDTSGNTNDWTVNNLVASDVVLDSPTNNFTTWNTLDRYNYNAPSEGNLRALTAGNNGTQAATFAVSSGKWYFEVRNGTAGSGTLARFVGIGKEETNLATIPYNNADNYMYYSINGNSYTGGTQTAYGDSWQADGDTIGVAFDADNGAIWFSKNGTWQNSATAAEIAAGTTTNAAFTGLSGTFVPIVSKTGGTSSNDPHHANFGQDSTFAGATTAGGNADANGYGDFKYAPPSGFLSLCSANLPTGAIDTLNDETPEDYFNTVLYSGNSTNNTPITVGLEPSMTWIKTRNIVRDHRLMDAVRGATAGIYPNLTNVEGGSPLISFDTDGFTLNNTDNYNNSGETYVSWNWKANGSGVSNTDGDITSTVSVGATSQQPWFSIVGYTGDGVSGTRTIGCGLEKKPDLVILKNRTEDNVSDTWFVYGTPLGSASPSPYLTLYNTDAVANSGVFVDTAFSDNGGNALFAVSGSYNGVNKSGTDYIAYCFANAEGLCKVGSYVGNGSSDGTFVYTGFRPAFVMLKVTNISNRWVILDNERPNYNPPTTEINPNSSAAEFGTTANMDFLSNGFKMRRTGDVFNTSGYNYIYLAIAEQPFKYANAR